MTQVVVGDRYVLQKIGPTVGSQCDESTLAPLGRSVNDLSNMREGTFFYDRDEQALYLKTGSPWEGVYELGVRGDILQVMKAHDVVIRGLEVRQTWGNCSLMRMRASDRGGLQADAGGLLQPGDVHLQELPGAAVRPVLGGQHGVSPGQHDGLHD